MIVKWIITAALYVSAYVIYRLLSASIIKWSLKMKRPLKMPNTMRMILGVIIFLLFTLVVLDMWGKSFTALVASLGIGGIVIGLALQEPLSNLAAGFLLLMSGAVKEGEAVEISGISGVVRSVNVNHTVIDTYDGKRVHIPNRTVWGEVVTKSWPREVRRMELVVGVAYDSDLEKVIRILQRCLEEEPLVEKEPSPQVLFDGFGSSSIDFKIRYWTRRENLFSSKLSLALRIKRSFDEEGVEIPFSQIDVHMKS